MFLTPSSRAARKRPTAANLHLKKVLSTGITLHVSTSGNDISGDGSLAKPFATPQAASDYIEDQLDLNGHDVNIQMANGSYPFVFIGRHSTSGAIIFRGNSTDASLVVIDSTLGSGGIPFQNQRHQVPVIGIADMTLKGQTVLDLSSESLISFWLWFGSKIILEIPVSADPNMFIWGPARFTDFASGGITINYTGGVNQRCFVDMDFGGVAQFAHIKTISGTPAWSDAFVKLSGDSLFEFDNAGPIVGTATGKKFIIQSGSTIVTHGTGFDVFPGDAVGEPFNGWYST